MYQELGSKIELLLNNADNRIRFIILNNKKSIDITKYLSDELIEMGLNVLNETYTITNFKWVIPSKGLVEKVNKEIYLNDKLYDKVIKMFSTTDMEYYISILSN